ncbi:MAG: hypothetical protein PHT66_00950 [Candidatus Pacebacteria bacterium]|nr:hypothetical protein [Candidatus Paceibacterota bacterium]
MPENFNLNSDFSNHNLKEDSKQNPQIDPSQNPISTPGLNSEPANLQNPEPAFSSNNQQSKPFSGQQIYEPATQQSSPQQGFQPMPETKQSPESVSGSLADQPFGQVTEQEQPFGQATEESFQQSPEQNIAHSFDQQDSKQASISQETEQKFSPPPSNVFIRTSESDLERIKSEGGTIPGIEPNFSEPSISSESTGSDIEGFSAASVPSDKKNNLIPILIIGILVIGGGLLAYFYLIPLLFNREEPFVVTTTTTTMLAQTTTTLASSPYPQISGPFQKSIFNVEVSGDQIVESIKSAALSELASPNTFKVLIPKIHNDPLTNDEVVLSLIPSLPVRLHPYLLAREYLVYAYYGEVNPSLGLVIDIGEESKEEVKSIFLSWEKNLGILTDLQELFLVDVPSKSSEEFQETNNADVEIRYFNYAGEEAAISYAFSDQYLIMSSSLEAVNSGISHLRGATEPINP